MYGEWKMATKRKNIKKSLSEPRDTNFEAVAAGIHYLVDMLNAKNDDLSEESRHHLIFIIRKIREAARIFKEGCDSGESYYSLITKSGGVGAAQKSINELLKAYVFVPVVSFPSQDLDDRTGEGLGYLHFAYGLAGQGFPSQEFMGIHLIINLLTRGNLYRLRECTECGKWFAAIRSSQFTCSVECRDKAYIHTEEYRAKKRDGMRKLYHEKKKASSKRSKVK